MSRTPRKSEGNRRFLAGSLLLLSLPVISWGFFPPIDLYPPPAIVQQPPAPQPIFQPPPDPFVIKVVPPVAPIMEPPVVVPPPAQVPEPASMVMGLIGLGTLVGYRWKRRKSSERGD